jgi:predicted phage tail protein
VSNVPPGTYFVRLQAQNAGGTSAKSNEVTVVVAAPAAPGPPVLQNPVVTGTTVTLTWTLAGAGGTPTSFLVTASLTPGGATIASIGTSTPTLTVTNVPPGTYYVRVRALNAVGTSLLSNEATIVVP